jgi:RNA recognition motif-containing protein
VNIYVGNLSRDVVDEDLHQAFSPFGQIESVNIIRDKFSGEPRGFGFVEMPAQAEAQAAITGLNGHELKGRAMSVNEARPRLERGHRGGGGGGGGRGGFGGGRGGGRSGGRGGRRSW